MGNPDKVRSGSRLFVGHRALGYVSNHVPLVTRYIRRRREHLVVTCVGRVFHTYGCAKLGLLSVSKEHPEDITCVAADAYLVFAASGGAIYAWRRGNELKHVYRVKEEDKGEKAVTPPSAIKLMLPFGPHLVSIDERSVLRVWDIKSEALVSELEFPFPLFEITALAHLPTYVNKVLLGSAKGKLQLWNLRSLKRVHSFSGWPDAGAVTCLEPAPAVDVVAVGLSSGDVVVHNVKFDETVVRFRQDWGPVSGLSFRSDGPPVLVSASPAGHIALWDLEEQKLQCQMRCSHSAAVTGARCLPGEPLMVTSSPDNTLKQWIFDMGDGGGRLLRIKEGHAAPPTRIRFYGALGNNILSSSEDSTLRSFSTVTELLNKSFGVASYNRKLSKKHKQLSNPVKMEPIIDFTAETTRDRDWSNVACVHRSTNAVTTWSFGNQKMGDIKLMHKRFKENRSLRSAIATCVCISVCGNFVVIGYDSGHVDRFNVQSGLHRGSYVAKGFEDKEDPAAHPGRKIRSVCTDGLNQLTVTGDNCGGMKFWRFDPHPTDSTSSTSAQLGRLSLESEVLSLCLHRDSNLCCAALADLSLAVLDVVSRTVVRRFPSAHANQVTDVAFSADSRWIVSASLDNTVKVWDVPTGHLVDRFRFRSAVTSLSLSPTGEFLATAHAGDLGIYLWTNVSLYQHVSLRPILSKEEEEKECPEILMPLTSVHQGGEGRGEDAKEDTSEPMEVEDTLGAEEEEEYVSPAQLSEDLITLANLPESRWKNLLSLDVIRARNKPKNPVQKPKDAPFFLPTIAGLETKFDLTPQSATSNKEVKEENGAKSEPTTTATSLTAFGRALMSAESAEELSSALALLREKGPAAVEIEVRSLSPEWGGTHELCRQFLLATCAALASRRHFEAIQAHLALFLKLHGDLILAGDGGGGCDLPSALEEAAEAHESAAAALNADLASAAAIAAFCRNALV